MGAFNSVKPPPGDVRCPRCGKIGTRWIQFKYGARDQEFYSVGDRLHWGWREEGAPGKAHVFVEGIIERCFACGYEAEDYGDQLYDIELRHDVIDNVTRSTGSIDYGEEDWVVIAE